MWMKGPHIRSLAASAALLSLHSYPTSITTTKTAGTIVF